MKVTPTLATYAFALCLIVGVGACMLGIPLQLTDNLVELLEVQRTPLLQGLADRFLESRFLRPLAWAQRKVLFELSGGHYFLTFKVFHILQVAATVLLFVHLLKVRTRMEFTAASVALVCLLGIHTLIGVMREGPATILFCCAAAAVLALADESTRWRDALAVLVLVYALFFVELGLLIWVVYVAAYIAGRRGISPPGLVGASLVVVGYFAIRFGLVNSEVPGMVGERGSGFGFSMLEPGRLKDRFGARPLVFYSYNVAAAISSVLFSEPRGGVWEFTRRAVAGELRPWLWINLVSSALGTSCIAWFVVMRTSAWVRREITREDALVLVFVAVLAGNAAISFAYTRDVVLAPAGLFYAAALYAAVRFSLQRLNQAGLLLRTVTLVTLLVLSTSWTLRTIGLTYILRETAFVKRNDWGSALAWLERSGEMPSDAKGRSLVGTLRRQALETPTPNPRLAQPWAEQYFDRVY